MRTASSLRDMPVLDVSNGTRLGQVERLIISPDDRTLLGMVTKSGGLFNGQHGVVQNADIRAIGPDAVTVRNGECVVPEEEADAQIREVMDGDRRFVGTRVVTQDGAALGRVDDVAIDESTRRLAALIVGKGLLASGDAIPAERIVSVGPDVVVVTDGAGQRATAEPDRSRETRDIRP